MCVYLSFFLRETEGQREGRVLSFFSSRWNWASPSPFTRRWVCVVYPLVQGGLHTRLRKRGRGRGGGPYTDEATDIVVSRYICTMCGRAWVPRCSRRRSRCCWWACRSPRCPSPAAGGGRSAGAASAAGAADRLAAAQLSETKTCSFTQDIGYLFRCRGNSSMLQRRPLMSLYGTVYQCCGSGMFIPDPRYEFFPSRIPDPNFFPSRIPNSHQRI